MLKIRLRRMGSTHKPFYRVVVSDSRRTPTASAIEEIGYYDPRKKPRVVSLDLDRVEYWKSHGAQLSDAVRKLVKQGSGAKAETAAASSSPGETPKAETPKAETPKAETPKAETKAETPKAETPKAETEAETAVAAEAAQTAETAEASAEAASA